ncbi:MAG TPA: EamA family transporter [Geminicoccaceae bacterium]|nr:EamA family transporter [Geminicoccus sp.]HMU52233.1 EamA family transporter [Geminicoccaceae bacterium]
MTPAEWAALLALSVLWGGGFFFTGVVVRELPPFAIVTLRVGLAAAALGLVIRGMGRRMPCSREAWRAFAVMGLLSNVVPFCLIVWAQTRIPSALASILNATTPLSTVIVAHFLTSDEKMTGNRLAGVVIGFAGVALMIGPSALVRLDGDVLGQLAVLAATLSYAFAGVFGRRFRRMGIGALETSTGQLTAATLMLLPLTLLVDHPWALPMPSPATWAAVLGISLLSTALAFVLYFRILATAGATNAVLVTFLIPVSAILLGTLVLGERLEAEHLAGMACIAAGLAVIDGRLLRLVRATA